MRIRVLVAVVIGGIALLLWLKPELGRGLQETILQKGPGADAGAAPRLGGEPEQPPQEPLVIPGAHMTFEFMGTPQSHYLGALQEDAGDAEFREMVQSLALGGGQYDPWLSRAARQLAYQGALFGDSPPEAALSFILRASGSPELSVAQVVVRATGDDPKVISEAIARALGNAPKGPGQLLVGVGEAATEGDKYDRRVVVVVARRDFDLEPTLRSVALNSKWLIRGTAPKNFRDAHASVLYPDLRVVEIPLAVDGGRFSLSIPTESEAGTLRVSIDGVGSEGPFKLLQLEAEIAGPPPAHFELLVPEAEEFPDLAAAERHALLLLNEDRRVLGLPPLELDLALSQVARGHSIEMRDKDYFAHQSPTTGLAGDRLARARYRASAHGENLALNDSVYEAEASLLESVGHRRNIINPSMTHVGIGLAKEEGEGGQVSWYLTQLFARKTMPFDAQDARVEFLERINAARQELDLEEVFEDRVLSDLAQEGCNRALESQDVEELPNWLAPRASRVAKSTVTASVHVFYFFEDLKPVATALQESTARLGLAFLRDEDDLHGKTLLVVITAE